MCGGRLEPRRFKPTEPERPTCDACGFVLYLDPKIAVGTIIADGENGIVLVRRAIQPGYGKWVFPGGYVDRGEDVLDAAVREAREESGLDVRLDGLINIYSYPQHTPIVIVYAASITGGSLCVDEECLEARFFAGPDIPWDELAFRTTHDALTDYYGGEWRNVRRRDS
jgi:8-oxo-dGTP diphosphatase